MLDVLGTFHEAHAGTFTALPAGARHIKLSLSLSLLPYRPDLPLVAFAAQRTRRWKDRQRGGTRAKKHATTSQIVYICIRALARTDARSTSWSRIFQSRRLFNFIAVYVWHWGRHSGQHTKYTVTASASCTRAHETELISGASICETSRQRCQHT